jgi:hypothetical protein
MAKDFKPTQGSRVSRKDAMEWIEKYDKEMRTDKDADTKSVFYGRDALLKILSEDRCAVITFFFALKHNEFVEKETVNLVLVATTEDGELLWADDASPQARGDGGAGTFDFGHTCPPYCPK